MSEQKKYQYPDEEPIVVAEPISSAYASPIVEDAVYDHFKSARADISRAITGEELLNRLRPRIKSLF